MIKKNSDEKLNVFWSYKRVNYNFFFENIFILKNWGKYDFALRSCVKFVFKIISQWTKKFMAKF